MTSTIDLLRLGKFATATALALGTTAALAGTIDFPASDGTSYDAIIVKLREDASRRDEAELRDALNASAASVAGQALDVFRLFGTGRTLDGQDERADPHGLMRYYRLVLPAGVTSDAHRINALMDVLAARADVDIVYPALRPVVAGEPGSDARRQSTLTGATSAHPAPDLSNRQFYLYAPDAPMRGYKLGGIDFHYASRLPGGQGENVTVMTMEPGGWDDNHADLPTSARNIGPYMIDRPGTATAGILMAAKDGRGITGIANKGTPAHASLDIENFVEIAGYLKRGDVLTIPYAAAAAPIAGCRIECRLPMEYMPAWADAIRTLTDHGVVVVENAGDSGIDLDHADLGGRFDRSRKDSGAILVGGICAADARRSLKSNYGSRIDSASWSCDDVLTTTIGSGTVGGEELTGYTESHGGTVAAASIVGGAAASASGYAQARQLPLSGIEVRTLLSSTGTTFEGGDSAVIGTHPDLKKAFVAIDECVESMPN